MNSKQEVVTFDHSRVIVWDRPEWLTTDYYNASFIDGYNGPREYLVSQGPNTKCIVSFWHMVWQEGVTCIVMATGLFENAVQQCDKYWVDKAHKHVQHGYIHIWHEGSTYLAQLNIRTFRIQKEGTCESRLLTHYEMVGFHDESPDPGLLLDVRRRVSNLAITQPGPILVHCRCGGGRTAVYVAIDYCLHQLHSEDRVDVYSTVLHLRRFRKNMVRTLAQYQQIYQAVAMYLQCGTTVYPAQTLVAAYEVHYSSDAKAFKLDREFQTLQVIVPRLSIGDCASGHRVENRSKSRDIMMLPPECARPYLSTSDCVDGGTDFINAVYIDGYHTENAFLATQWPLKKTIADFWRMLFDFKITSIVLMNDLHKFTRNYLRFWPKEVDHVASYGPISVRYLSCDKMSHITIRTFAIRKPKRHPHLIAQTLMRISEDVMIMNNLVGCEIRQDEIIVKMFQVFSSRTDGNVKSCNGQYSNLRSHVYGGMDTVTKSKKKGIGIVSKSLLTVMEHVSDWQRRSSSRQPICIMSKDGCSRVGLYCAINICCDQVKVEKEVDVFNAVRLVRKNRPQLVPDLEEYRYIYYFMSEFILLSATKPDIFDSDLSLHMASHSSSFHRIATSTMSNSNSVHGGVYVIEVSKEKNSGKVRTKWEPNDKVQMYNETYQNDSSQKYQHLLQVSSFDSYNDLMGLNKLPPRINILEPNHSENVCVTKQQSNGQTAESANANGLILSASSLHPVRNVQQPTSLAGVSSQHLAPSLSSMYKPSTSPESVLFIPQFSHLPTSHCSHSVQLNSMTSSISSNSFATPDVSGSRPPSQLSPCSINITASPVSSSFLSCHSSASLHMNEYDRKDQYSLHNGSMPSSDLTQTILHHSSQLVKLHTLENNQNQTSVCSPFQQSAAVRFEDAIQGELPADVKLIHASYVSLEESLSSSSGEYQGSLDCINDQIQFKHKKFNGTKKRHEPASDSLPLHQNGRKLKESSHVSPTSVVGSSSFKQKIHNYLSKLNKDKVL
ncbi:receptor-type tyrosine-protein phosphatase kappa-like isoform X3 [Biomphalaria glabrata]|nr:receptor-type tyrosine-protein phosphatase kappa-like isoform X3 [Biomphalaria glabrata]